MIKIKKPIAKLHASETRLGMEVKGGKKRKLLYFANFRVMFKDSKYNFNWSAPIKGKIPTDKEKSAIKAKNIGKKFDVGYVGNTNTAIYKECIGIRFINQK